MPLFAGSKVAPPSSLRKTPAAEIPIQSRSAFSGSSAIEWVISPPAPGNQRSRVGCSRIALFARHVAPESSERKRTPGSPPSQSVPGCEA